MKLVANENILKFFSEEERKIVAESTERFLNEGCLSEKMLEKWMERFELYCFECRIRLIGPEDTKQILTGFRPTTSHQEQFNGSKLDYVCAKCFKENQQKYLDIFERVWKYAEKHREFLKEEIKRVSYFDGREIK